ncbi:MAG: D-alanyl-D-alanine carboxypeptidase family protein [Synechococcaceae cyanobacterium SM2_3_2]|nr:D-alanyl-D-alanine carboxypeptidase family protein [Synechococcaceae cyanobacterium SM2_3_2]
MQTAARQSGIQLVPLSGYRDLPTQTFLFQRQIQRRGSERAARFLSAPPGFSEHHTGYAVDIGDGSQPSTHVQYAFAQTSAYGWLQAQAGSYGFELSFPPDNPQGVSFEPWHWRYVGTAQASQLFVQARELTSQFTRQLR